MLTWVLVTVAAIGCGLAVVALDWKNISGVYIFPLPVPPTWAFTALAVGAAILNAIGEEALLRGLLADLDDALVPRAANVAAQALSFWLAHYHGIPNGPIGVLAAAAFSVFM